MIQLKVLLIFVFIPEHLSNWRRKEDTGVNSCAVPSDCRVWKLVFGHDSPRWSDSFCWYNLHISHKHGILSSSTVNFLRKHPRAVHAFSEMCGICRRPVTVVQKSLIAARFTDHWLRFEPRDCFIKSPARSWLRHLGGG